MIRVIGIYRWAEGASFDHQYYQNTHMQLTRDLLTPLGLVRLEADRYLAANLVAPGTIIAASHAYFPSIEIAKTALSAVGATLMADVANYTTLKPELSFAVVTSVD